MTAYRVTHRLILGARPDQVRDTTVGYYLTRDLAKKEVEALTCGRYTHEEWFFMDVYTSTLVPNVEYIIDDILIQEEDEE